MDKKETGYIGEDAVCNYLVKKGCRIICRNFCIRGGEIDIIASDDDFIAFVEVKTRQDNSLTSGLEAVTKSKQRLIIKTAEAFLLKNSINLQPRFDAAEIIVSDGKPKKIRYIKNAFDASR